MRDFRQRRAEIHLSEAEVWQSWCVHTDKKLKRGHLHFHKTCSSQIMNCSHVPTFSISVYMLTHETINTSTHQSPTRQLLTMTFISTSLSTTITITLPETGVSFQIHKDLLCSKSESMRICPNGNIREAEENKINLT